jgi:rod shape-determining protein MreC
MNSLLRSQRKQSSVILYLSRPVRELIRKFSFVLLVLIALFSIFVSKVDSPFTHAVKLTLMDYYSKVAQVVVVPFDKVAVMRENLNGYFLVYSKNAQLQKENEQLRHGLSLLSSEKEENKRLKSLLNFVKDRHYHIISARIVSDASGPFMRSIVINAGANADVKKGLAVIGETGLVGRTLDVGKYSTHVLLLTDVNSKIPVMSSISRQRSVLAGNNTDYPSLLYLPKDTALQEGEEVFTSGDGGLFPPGLPIGIVYKDSGGSYGVRPYAVWERLEHLSVITAVEENGESTPEIEPLLSDPYSTYN